MRSEVRRLPSLFLNRLRQIIPSQKWDSIANTFTESKPTTFRINSLKRTVKEAGEILKREGFRLQNVSWYPHAFIVRKGRLRELERTEIYQTGGIYVQSLSSMVPPIVLSPKPQETVLDLTAAPGGKTTQMACFMNNRGRIVANESNRIRYDKLLANLRSQQAEMVEPLLGYGESMGKKYPEQFDRVLLDAPCSTEGQFETSRPATYRHWRLETIGEMAKQQKKLLRSAFSALKPGGVLVYSTCTFAPEENEGVLSDFLEQFGNAAKMERIRFSLPHQMAGLGSWEGKKYHPDACHAIRILPTQEMEGFFVARLRKKGK